MLVYRLLSTPSQQMEYTNTAVVNGFNKQLIDKKIQETEAHKETITLSTLDRMSSTKSLLTILGHIINFTKSSNNTT